jgi:hypothetical protein
MYTLYEIYIDNDLIKMHILYFKVRKLNYHKEKNLIN